MSVPYANANSTAARAEITKILRRFGCESIGFMDDFADHSVILAFKHRGRAVQLRASAAGWARLWLEENPWSPKRRSEESEWKKDALDQGLKAVNSILRDWIKGQITAVECGILSFDGVFMPYMLTNDGRPLIERINVQDLLPAPENGSPHDP